MGMMESLAQYRSRVGLFALVAGSKPKNQGVGVSTRNIKTNPKNLKRCRKMKTKSPTLKRKCERLIQGITSLELLLLMMACCIKLFSNTSDTSVCSQNFAHLVININKFNIYMDEFHLDVMYFEHRLQETFRNEVNKNQHANRSIKDIYSYVVYLDGHENYSYTNDMSRDMNPVSNLLFETNIWDFCIERSTTHQDRNGYIKDSFAISTILKEKNTRTACSHGTCCFLLGNKGTHCYNGNPPGSGNEVCKILEEWNREDIFYINTNYTAKIIDMIYETWCKCVIVAGDPSVGKTSTIRHVSLWMEKRGCELYIIKTPKELLQYSPSEDWRIFIIDDIFGKTSLDMCKIKQWKECERKTSSLLGSKTTLLISVRMEYIHDRELKKQDFSFLRNRRVITIGYKHYLLSNEDMMKELKDKLDVSDQIIEDVSRSFEKCSDLRMFAWFPFLCNVFCRETIIRSHSRTFFIDPVPILQEFFMNLKYKNRVLFCGLVLCLHSDGFESDLDIINNSNSGIGYRYENIASRLDTQFLNNIENFVNSLEEVRGLFVSKNRSTFHISHILVAKIVKDILENHLREIGEETDTYIRIPDLTLSDIDSAICPVEITNQVPSCEAKQEFLDIINGLDVDVDGEDKEGYTPLTIAVQTGNLYYVQCLLRRYAYVNKHDRTGCTPLDYAIRNRRLDIARLLIFNNADVNLSGKKPNILTPLYTACYKGYNELVKLLLRYGADSNQEIQDKSYRVKSGVGKEDEIDIDHFEASSPLGLACNHGHFEIVKTLIENGADANIVDRNDLTPLEYSVHGKYRDIIEYLLKHKTDVNRIGAGIWAKTVLSAACYNGNVELVRLLLHHGADVNKMDGSGRTPLERSVDANENDIMNILIEKGANVNIRGDGPYASTPLCTACYKGYLSIVKLLIQNKAKVNETDGNGSTPLHRAFDGNNLNIVNLLFTQGAIITDIEQFGSSLLSTACYEGNISIVKHLLRHVNVNLCDSQGRFPLERAVAGNQKEIYKLLMRYRDTSETDVL